MQQLYLIKYPKNSTPILELIKSPIPKPQDQEVLIRHTAIGVNFQDYEYYRGTLVSTTGSIIPGMEAVGVIEKIGKDVQDFKVGQRVGYCTLIHGAYSHYRTINTSHLFAIPDSITDEAAATNMLKGMTAHYLMRRTFFVHPDMTILIHSASSAVGQTMIRLAKNYKAQIIATVGDQQKIPLLKKLGCKHILNYNNNWAQEVLDITNNQGVSVVYDFLGKKTVLDSISCLKNFGLMVIAGQITGRVISINPKLLTQKSLFLTTPQLYYYKKNEIELLLSALEIFGLIQNDTLPKNADHIYDFYDIPQIFQDIESRQKPGSKIITI